MSDGLPFDHSRATRAIERVLVEYCRLVDENRPTDIVELFDPDAIFDYGLDRVFRGRDQLLGLFRDGLARHEATSHHLSNIVVDVGPTADVATASATIYAWHRRRDGVEIQLWGRYTDHLGRAGVDAPWRFTSRSLRVAGARHDSASPPVPPMYERFSRQDS